MFFKVTIKYNTTTEHYIVFALDAAHCESKVNASLKDSMYDYEITRIRRIRVHGVID